MNKLPESPKNILKFELILNNKKINIEKIIKNIKLKSGILSTVSEKYEKINIEKKGK